MILKLPPDTPLENYVLVASMAGHSWADGEWDPGECECGGSPPPTFTLPPPPPPPTPTPPDAAPRHHCQGPAFTCPSLLGAREDQRSPSVRAPLAVVIVSAATLLVLVIVAAIIVCRVRGRGRSPKGCTELSGAIIYDDLPSAPTIVPARTRPRFKPVPVDGGEMMGMTMGGRLYTAHPRSNPPSEHLYQSISSGSETCSYSTSEAAGQEGRALLRPSHPRSVRTAAPADTDSEEESLAPIGVLGQASDNDTPSVSPAHSRYYCASAPPCTSSPGSGSDYESVYYVGGTRRGRPLTPQQRGLPLLPSRTDRFRIYFSEGRGQRRTPRRRGTDRRQPHHHRIQKNSSEAEPLYENLT
ncbi:uncharacterized protein [Panulirus ornatus]|uniref:uncharacterized protein isoform X2 n=1 Tax=Panulirus ornatus TaxID=150431 RepID=UPI003A847E8C